MPEVCPRESRLISRNPIPAKSRLSARRGFSLYFNTLQEHAAALKILWGGTPVRVRFPSGAFAFGNPKVQGSKSQGRRDRWDGWNWGAGRLCGNATAWDDGPIRGARNRWWSDLGQCPMGPMEVPSVSGRAIFREASAPYSSPVRSVRHPGHSHCSGRPPS